MNLKEFFDKNNGRGIFSSAGANGRVTSAIYSTPRIDDNGRLAFIMRERLTYTNLKSNPFASYLFMADTGAGGGIRLYLRKIGEDDNPELLSAMTRRHLTPEEDQARGPKHIVNFEVEKILPLIGEGDTGISPD